MKISILLILILFSYSLQAQNLISNPGFENYSALPTTYGEYNLATGWENCSGGGTPDYFNTSGTVGTYFGTNIPHTGDGMGGFCPYHSIIIGFREYLSTALSSPLVIGQTYDVSFWLASGINGGYGYGCNNIGVTFSMVPLVQAGTAPILVTPQVEITSVFYDTLWTHFSFQYTATSAFGYFAIGNFRDDASTSVAQFGIAYDAVYYFVDDIEVTLSNQPPVALFSAPNHICPGTCTDFVNHSLNATSYLWTFAGATPTTSTDVNPANICYNSPGSYNVSLIATNTITTDTLTLNNFITVFPYPAPQGINQSGDTLFANQGSVTYQWYYNGNSINGAIDYFYIAAQSGDYNVVATDANGCEVEAVIFDVIAGLDNRLSMAKGISVFPNPATHILKICCESEIKSMEVYNTIGEQILISLSRHKGSKNQIELDVQALSSGVYFIEVACSKRNFRTKFFRQ